MTNFTYQIPTKIVFGKDEHKNTGKIISEFGIKKVLLHYGGGSIKKNGCYADVVNSLLENNIEYTECTSIEDAISELDILYMTRVQKERFFNEADYERLKDSCILNTEKMKEAKSDMIVLHPLPRVNEITTAVDEDPRACYFKQAMYGKYIRMALILKLLEVE